MKFHFVSEGVFSSTVAGTSHIFRNNYVSVAFPHIFWEEFCKMAMNNFLVTSLWQRTQILEKIAEFRQRFL